MLNDVKIGDWPSLGHNTDPTTVTFHSTETSFVLTAGGAITGVRLFWS